MGETTYGVKIICHRVTGPEYSVFVGDLTPEIDDLQLYEFFVKKYASCKGGKVVTDPFGNSRGYGFVKFSDENEQKAAMEECQNANGLGGKPIRISIAIAKSNKTSYQQNQNYNYSQYYQQYQNYYSQWGYDPYSSYNYGYGPYGTATTALGMAPPTTTNSASTEIQATLEFQQSLGATEDTDEEAVEDFIRKELNPLRSYVGPGPTSQFSLSGPMSDPVRHHQKDTKNRSLVVFSPEKAEKTIQWPSENEKKGVSHEY
ncbi:UNVERIFIED_CONTAM: hypothetical protein FKN15_024241 [Acipenser sinensis]